MKIRDSKSTAFQLSLIWVLKKRDKLMPLRKQEMVALMQLILN